MKAPSCQIVILMLLSACSGFEPIESESVETAIAELRIGDEVRVLTKGGNKMRFTLEAIDEEFLIGDVARVPIDDISTISHKPPATGEAAEVIGGTIGLILGIGLLVALGL